MTKKAVLSDEKRLLKANHDKSQQHQDSINMKELNSVSFKRDMRPADMEKYGIYSLNQM